MFIIYCYDGGDARNEREIIRRSQKYIHVFIAAHNIARKIEFMFTSIGKSSTMNTTILLQRHSSHDIFEGQLR